MVALTFTNDDAGDTTTNYNPYFSSYIGHDCQNFVSQCLWHGFSPDLGFEDMQEHIEARQSRA